LGALAIWTAWPPDYISTAVIRYHFARRGSEEDVAKVSSYISSLTGNAVIKEGMARGLGSWGNLADMSRVKVRPVAAPPQYCSGENHCWEIAFEGRDPAIPQRFIREVLSAEIDAEARAPLFSSDPCPGDCDGNGIVLVEPASAPNRVRPRLSWIGLFGLTVGGLIGAMAQARPRARPAAVDSRT
jgi:hypothetical protein